MLPNLTPARVVRGECAFELALEGSRRSGAAGDRPVDSDAIAMENVQQLIAAVADYHEVVVVDERTKRYLEGDASVDADALGSELFHRTPDRARLSPRPPRRLSSPRRASTGSG